MHKGAILSLDLRDSGFQCSSNSRRLLLQTLMRGVPRTQLSQLNMCLENVGQNMKWQARAENVKHFAMWAKEHEKQKCKDNADVDMLAATFDLGVTSKGPGSNAMKVDDAMDVDKGKEGTTKKNGGTGGDGKGPAAAGVLKM